jgi:quinol monooxygenase YgiN
MNTFVMLGAFVAHIGKEEELLTILGEHSMDRYPGCLTYRIFRDPEQKEKIWIFEEWKSEEDHKNSLNDPSIRDAIRRAMPLIESFPHQYKLIPVT